MVLWINEVRILWMKRDIGWRYCEYREISDGGMVDEEWYTYIGWSSIDKRRYKVVYYG